MRIRSVGFSLQRPFSRGFVFISLGLLGLGACHTAATAGRWVRVSRSSIPLSEVRKHARVDIEVKAESDLSVIKVTVGFPPQAEWHGIEVVQPDLLWRGAGFRGGDRPSLHWSGGEITPGTQGSFPVLFRALDAEAGDTLFFPVEVLLSDSSIVELNGPPGSQSAAPMVIVRTEVHRER